MVVDIFPIENYRRHFDGIFNILGYESSVGCVGFVPVKIVTCGPKKCPQVRTNAGSIDTS